MSTVCATCSKCGEANDPRSAGAREGFVVALAGNPNTGKSTVFNALTGLRQHTGNWPGKTVSRAEGHVVFGGHRFNLTDLPGTYSLLARSVDEEIARDFLLFGQPDVTVVVLDATRLERNLNLALQVLEITDRVVVCLNLVDEARRKGIVINHKRLARDLGVPVIPTTARRKEGLDELLRAVTEVATGAYTCTPRRIQGEPPQLRKAVNQLTDMLNAEFPGLPNARWVALQLLDGDERVVAGVRSGEFATLAARTVDGSEDESPATRQENVAQVLDTAESLRWELGPSFHDSLVETIYADAGHIAERAIESTAGGSKVSWERRIDRIVTSRVWGFPLMILLFSVVFWLTIVGANYPSRWLSYLLLDNGYPLLREGMASIGAPWWLTGFLVDGVYLATAWVVSVMLPPMAIFFPMFTLLEDLGYLPRVAFNLDSLFRRAGAHGKQSLSMMMGYGCNAAGVIATRIIDSPRERLLAIVTNNFSLCNGRWPTQILIATIFIGPLVPAALAGLISAGAVVGVAMLGVALTFIISWSLSRTVLRGEVSTFSLELPPYRPPQVLQTIYTSLIDRTIFVLFRAIVFAVPAGAVIWLICNVHIAGATIAEHAIALLGPLAWVMGLNGVILVAYIVAIPANEIVVPTVLMLTVLVLGAPDTGAGAGVMFETSERTTGTILAGGGWTLLTAVNLMLFSLVHNPCSTTIYTIWKETRSLKWTSVATLLPLGLGVVLCVTVAAVWRLVA